LYRQSFITIFTLAILSFAAQAQDAITEEITIYKSQKGTIFNNETFIVNNDNSPVQIISAKAKHIPSETAALAKQYWKQLYKYLSDSEKEKLRRLSREGLRIIIGAKGDDAVAVKFGVIAYDAFKEHLGGLTAITMDPPDNKMTWDFKPAYLFKFRKYGVVGVYVRQVRLKDGKIWNYSPKVILKEFSQRYKEVTKQQIENLETK
jgi:hypothetical protein